MNANLCFSMVDPNYVEKNQNKFTIKHSTIIEGAQWCTQSAKQKTNMKNMEIFKEVRQSPCLPEPLYNLGAEQ